MPVIPAPSGETVCGVAQTFPSIGNSAKLSSNNAEGSPRAARVEEANQDGI